MQVVRQNAHSFPLKPKHSEAVANSRCGGTGLPFSPPLLPTSSGVLPGPGVGLLMLRAAAAYPSDMDPAITETLRRWDAWNAQLGVCHVNSLTTFFSSLCALKHVWSEEPQLGYVLFRLREHMEHYQQPATGASSERLYGYVVSRTCYAQALRIVKRTAEALSTVEAVLATLSSQRSSSFFKVSQGTSSYGDGDIVHFARWI